MKKIALSLYFLAPTLSFSVYFFFFTSPFRIPKRTRKKQKTPPPPPSLRDRVLQELDKVVKARRPLVVRVLDALAERRGGLRVGHRKHKPRPERLERRAVPEARQPALAHERHGRDDGLRRAPGGQEPSDAQLDEPFKLRRRPLSPRVEQLAHLVAELERRSLETQVAAGRDAEDEPKVDVDEVPVPGDHDVAVVSVLGVEQVAGDGVAGMWFVVLVSVLVWKGGEGEGEGRVFFFCAGRESERKKKKRKTETIFVLSLSVSRVRSPCYLFSR